MTFANSYVHALVDNNLSFKQFALRCAREFGVLVSMRDESWDVPILTEIEPSSYHLDGIKKAEQDLKNLQAQTPQALHAQAVRNRNATLLEIEKGFKKAKHERPICEKMLAKVQSLEVDGDHLGWKSFMERSLTEALDAENLNFYTGELARLNQPINIEVERANRLESIQSSLEYHTIKWDEELARCKDRTEWLVKMREAIERVEIKP